MLASIATRIRFLLAADQTTAFDFVLNVQSANALVLALIFVALRIRVRSATVLRALDVAATFTTASTAAVGLSNAPSGLHTDVSAVAFFVLFFVVRAALVPGKPWVATALAAGSGLPFLYGVAVMYRDAGPALMDPALPREGSRSPPDRARARSRVRRRPR